jgi:glycosyltransferase involved in cell wall biosynthesis
MRVGWLADTADTVGGAELTQQAFADAAPAIPIADCHPGQPWPDEVDVWVVHNFTQYDASIIPALETAPVVKYWHDMCPHGDPVLRDWLCEHAHNVFCSPLHRERFPWMEGGDVCPPAIDLARFREAREALLHRSGTLWFGHALNHGKGIDRAVAWAETNEIVDFFGSGPLMPTASDRVRVHGPVRPDQAPAVMAGFERLLFLPTALEPFGRVVAEAAAAGCDVITNHNVGARHYLENDPDALESAADDFWYIVEERAGL